MKKFIMVVLTILFFIVGSNIGYSTVQSGKYVSNNKEYSELLYLYGDKFFYRVNICEGYVFLVGKYVVTNNELVLVVDSKKSKGDLNLKQILFKIENKTEIVPVDTVGCDMSSNKKYLYERIDVKVSRVDSLRVRESSDLKSKVLTMINKGEKVYLIDYVTDEVIVSGVKGRWVLVMTEKEQIGYCFDSFLE